VTDVENVEHAVRKYEFLARIAQVFALDEQFIARHNLFPHWGQT